MSSELKPLPVRLRATARLKARNVTVVTNDVCSVLMLEAADEIDRLQSIEADLEKTSREAGTFIPNSRGATAAEAQAAHAKLEPGEQEPPTLLMRLRGWPGTFGLGDAFEAGFVASLMTEAADAIERLGPTRLLMGLDMSRTPGVAVAQAVRLAPPTSRDVAMPDISAGRLAILDKLVAARRSGSLGYLSFYKEGREDGGAGSAQSTVQIEGTIDLADLLEAFAMAAAGGPDYASRLKVAETENALLMHTNQILRGMLDRSTQSIRRMQATIDGDYSRTTFSDLSKDEPA